MGARKIRKRTGEAGLDHADAAADVHRPRLRVELEAVFEEREVIVRTKTGFRRAGRELREFNRFAASVSPAVGILGLGPTDRSIRYVCLMIEEIAGPASRLSIEAARS